MTIQIKYITCEFGNNTAGSQLGQNHQRHIFGHID